MRQALSKKREVEHFTDRNLQKGYGSSVIEKVWFRADRAYDMTVMWMEELIRHVLAAGAGLNVSTGSFHGRSWASMESYLFKHGTSISCEERGRKVE